MQKFNLSVKALHSLLDRLVAIGALRKSEVEERSSLCPGSVVIDLSKGTYAGERKERPTVSRTDAALRIRSRMDDSSLMNRYGISAKGLRRLFRKLVAAGVIQQSELDGRMSETHTWAVFEE